MNTLYHKYHTNLPEVRNNFFSFTQPEHSLSRSNTSADNKPLLKSEGKKYQTIKCDYYTPQCVWPNADISAL
jgi:hypothetical protein